MSNVQGINPTGPARPIQSVPPTKATAASVPTPATDSVEISPQARVASMMANIPPVRADLVARVKAEIQAGTYETPEKLDKAISNLMDEMES